MEMTNVLLRGPISPSHKYIIYDIVSLVIYFVATLFIVFAVLRYFTKKSKIPWAVYITLFVTYVTLFYSLALITIDLSAGLYAKTKLVVATSPSSSDAYTYSGAANDKPNVQNEPQRYMVIIWQIMYWFIQLLAWIIVPVSQSYAFSAEFHFHRKLLGAIIENMILYLVMAVAGVVALIGLVIYVLRYNATSADHQITLSWSMLLGVGQSLSNGYGLLLLILLLGYGIVDFPRTLWKRANLRGNLSDYESQAARLYFDLSEAKDRMECKLGNVRRIDIDTPSEHELRPLVNKIATHWERTIEERGIEDLRSSRSSGQHTVSVSDMRKKDLTSLHRACIESVSDYDRVSYQWKYLKRRAFFLEDVIKSVYANHGDLRSRRIVSSLRRRRVGWRAKLLDLPEWIYYAYLRGVFLRVLALSFIPVSLVILYSEFTPLFHSVLKKSIDISVVSLMIRSMAPYRPLVQIVALVWVVLIALVTLFALFRVKIYSWYTLIPHHSNVKSVMYTAVFLCRVVPTLCFNFLQLVGVRVDDGVAFYKVMGTLRLDGLKGLFGKVGYLEILGGGFSNFFPLVMVVISCLSLFNVWQRVGALFARVDEKDVEEGRDILQQGTYRGRSTLMPLL